MPTNMLQSQFGEWSEIEFPHPVFPVDADVAGVGIALVKWNL